NRPYLSIPKEERLCRLDAYFPELNGTDDLGRLVSQIQRSLRQFGRDNDSAEIGPLLTQLGAIASLIQPDGRAQKRVCKVAIPVNAEGKTPIYRQDVETAFRAWLLVNFPNLPEYKDRGRANEGAR